MSSPSITLKCGSANSFFIAALRTSAPTLFAMNGLKSESGVNRLTPDSDFKPFMANNVGAEVRNAAMKKLFADPHFNVMDGLDIYIGDYSQPDPISPSMLRQMAGAKFLNLFAVSY